MAHAEKMRAPDRLVSSGGWGVAGGWCWGRMGLRWELDGGCGGGFPIRVKAGWGLGFVGWTDGASVGRTAACYRWRCGMAGACRTKGTQARAGTADARAEGRVSVRGTWCRVRQRERKADERERKARAHTLGSACGWEAERYWEWVRGWRGGPCIRCRAGRCPSAALRSLPGPPPVRGVSRGSTGAPAQDGGGC